MSDTIYPGATWRMMITISDDDGPVDPTDMTAVMCPDVELTVTPVATGEYEIGLDEAATALLEPGGARWEFWGRVGPDLLLIASRGVTVAEVCGP